MADSDSVHTALMPFSCCADCSSRMERSCQRTLRSVNSSQGFLAWKLAVLFFSLLMSSHSWSHAAPCSSLRATESRTAQDTLWLQFDTLLLSSDQAPGSGLLNLISSVFLYQNILKVKVQVVLRSGIIWWSNPPAPRKCNQWVDGSHFLHLWYDSTRVWFHDLSVPGRTLYH